jgi:hypothetical protein
MVKVSSIRINAILFREKFAKKKFRGPDFLLAFRQTSW